MYNSQLVEVTLWECLNQRPATSMRKVLHIHCTLNNLRHNIKKKHTVNIISVDILIYVLWTGTST